uniref:Uncharacterized protein n=1 Tax=Meloidogyne javanica TaxID=6303 RepID=A0A915LL77_MELJA
MSTLNDTESNKRVGFDTVRTIYSISAGLSFSLGIILNMLLAWLILTKTVNAMRILQDILIVIVSTLVQPIPIVDHGYRALFQNGVFRNFLPQPYAYMYVREAFTLSVDIGEKDLSLEKLKMERLRDYNNQLTYALIVQLLELTNGDHLIPEGEKSNS